MTGAAKVRSPVILDRLKRAYPDARCALDHRNPFQLLVATILSAQTTDVRVNLVTPKLFSRYPNAAALARARPADVEAIIRSTGFFRNKARSIIGMAQAVVADHGGEVPGTMDDLLTLPGVGRKTANLVLILAHASEENICVDTHVHRIANRLGWVRTRTPEQTEHALYRAAHRKWWPIINLYLVTWGQNVCRPVYPLCPQCVLADICPKVGVTKVGKLVRDV